MKIKLTFLALAIGLSAATQASSGDIYMSTEVQGHFNRVDTRVEMRGPSIFLGQRAHAQAEAPTVLRSGRILVPPSHALRSGRVLVPPSRITSLTIGRNNTTRIDSRGHGQLVHVETLGQHNTTSIRLGNN